MRTDVKVGLICVFAVILGVVIYFVMQGNNHPQPAQAGTASGSTPHANAPASGANPSPAASVQVSSPVATAPAATPSIETSPSAAAAPGGLPGNMATLAQATPSGGPGSGIGGGLIAPPSPSSPIVGASPATQPSGALGTTGLTGGALIPAAAPATQPTRTTFGAPPAGSTFGNTPSADRGTIEFGRSSSPSGSNAPTGGVYGGNSFGASPYGAAPAPRGSSVGQGSTTVVTGGHSTSAGTYKIEKGDMLVTIAKKNNVTVKAIEAANPGIDANRLKVGQSINIPAPAAGGTGAASSAAAAPGGTHTPATRPAGSRTAAASRAGSSVAAAAKPGSSYTVKKGDTLAKIAESVYGDKKSWRRIFRANRGDIADPDVVPVGTVLRLPG